VPAQATLICCIGTIGKIGFTTDTTSTNQQITAAAFSHGHRFFYYFLLALRPELELSATGNVVRILNSERLGNVLVALPPRAEQNPIAAFLDRETAKIDALIAEQQRLIELLQEKRQAVISHAVTKGLNPDAPMKDSGIEWLGEVPEHWELGKVKHYFKTCSGGTPTTAEYARYYAEPGEGHPWVRTTDLTNDLVVSVPVHITEQAIHDTACAILPVGTVMIAMYGGEGTVGKNGLLMVPAAINQALCGLLPSTAHDPRYTLRYMQYCRPYWMIGAESSRKDPNISQEQVQKAPVPCPPIGEQRLIASVLDEKAAAFDLLSAEALRAIALLQERRSALISAAVTGQIDVRGFSSEESEAA
jgi:type I restriction enzyme S subunit